jgi:hypothetical protein
MKKNNINITSDVKAFSTPITSSSPQNGYNLNELKIDNEIDTKNLIGEAKNFFELNFENKNLVKCIKDGENLVFIAETSNVTINRDLDEYILEIVNLKCIGLIFENNYEKIKGAFKPNVEIKDNIVKLKQ